MAGLELSLLSMVLVMALLAGGFFRRLVRHYPLFYIYLACVLITDVLLMWSWTSAKAYYLSVYWYSQLACVALGFGIIWEVYGQIFKNFPGTARMARFLVTFALAAVFINAIIESILGHPSTMIRVSDIEKNMRIVQAILLTLSMGLMSYYEIPLGRNVAGILFGYGCFVSSGIMLLTAREQLGLTFYPIWAHGQTVAYLLMLSSWLYAMRTYHPVPITEPDPTGGLEYPFVPRNTRKSMARIKSSLGKALQP